MFVESGMLRIMYRVMLTPEQREDLRQRTRQAGLAASTRDRLEMVRLADAGWRVPQIARHLRQHEQTVRTWIKAFLAGGFEALSNKPRGGDHSALTPDILDAVRGEIATGQRPWPAGLTRYWVAEHHGVGLSPGRMRVHLKRARLSYQRTSRSLAHKQDPQQVAERTATLGGLEKGGRRA